MTPERHQRIGDLYHRALELPADRRAAFLAAACDGDDALGRDVWSLLQAHEQAGTFMEAPAIEIAAAALAATAGAAPFQSIGHFDVRSLLGSGGMGEVYRAHDRRLGRDVALKILPDRLALDAEHLARFEREARLLAALNHPNIAALYGLEDADGRQALVLELVEGVTLADRLASGPLPLAESFAIGRQIADALDAAHEQGIVHRDLKPANVTIRPDGTVKVLDFGIAKALAPASDSTASAAAPQTQPQAVLGTAAYMSPEQARGEPATRHADIWAFGVVLYELLTGVSPFARPTTAETIAAVLGEQPDHARLPAGTPPAVRHLIRRCLEKDRKRRLQHVGDARLELDDTIAGLASEEGIARDMPRQVAGRRRWLPVVAGFAVGIVVLGAFLSGGFLYSRDRPEARSEETRFSVYPPEGNVFHTPVIGGYAAAVGGAIAPDGRTVAFTASDSTGRILLWIRPLRETVARALPATDGAALPFWSPDSRSLGFFAEGRLKRIDVENGTVRDLSRVGRARGGAWNRDGVIVFAPGLDTGLRRVDAAGGEPQPVTRLGEGDRSHRFPSFLPDGRRFLYYAEASTSAGTGVFVGDLDGGTPRRVLAADTAAIHARSGHLLFVRQATLFAQPFDIAALQVRGDPVPLAESVPNEGTSPAFSVSSDGEVLTYRADAVAQQQQFAWFDRTGGLIELVGPPGSYRGVDLSPDATRIAIHRHDGAGGDVWVLEPGGAMTRVTFDAAQDNSSPIWLDGRRIAFASRRNGRWGLYHKLADATEADESLIDSEEPVSPASSSSDARHLVYWSFGRGGGVDQSLLSLVDRRAAPLLHSRFAETHGQISPDRKWLAYAADAAGRLEVFVCSFPACHSVKQVSVDGGVMPRWRSDGRELFYATSYDRSKLMAVSVHGDGAEFALGPRQELFDTGMVLSPHSLAIPTYHSYAVSLDGQRFLLPRPVSRLRSDAPDTPITVVLNWNALLDGNP